MVVSRGEPTRKLSVHTSPLRVRRHRPSRIGWSRADRPRHGRIHAMADASQVDCAAFAAIYPNRESLFAEVKPHRIVVPLEGIQCPIGDPVGASPSRLCTGRSRASFRRASFRQAARQGHGRTPTATGRRSRPGASPMVMLIRLSVCTASNCTTKSSRRPYSTPRYADAAATAGFGEARSGAGRLETGPGH